MKYTGVEPLKWNFRNPYKMSISCYFFDKRPKSKTLDAYSSILRVSTCLNNQGGHKLHSYKACKWLQNLYVLVEFVKNHIRQMVRLQLPFCIPFKNDSMRFQWFTRNIIFLQPLTKTDFLCSHLQKFWRLKFTSNFR